MSRLLRDSDIVPGAVAVAVLLLVQFLLDLPLLAGLGIAVAVYLGVRLLMPEEDPEIAPGVRRSQLVTGLAAMEQRLVRVTQLGGGVVKPDVRQRVDSLIATSGRVIAHVRQDPADLPVARPLLELYLDSTAGILTNYVHLSSRPVASAEEPLAKVETESVPLLEAKVTELYEQLQREEVVALSVDSELVEFRTRGIT